MFDRWVVLVKVSYNSVSFEFENADLAVDFARKALKGAWMHVNNEGGEAQPVISIFAKSSYDDEKEDETE